MYKDIIVGKLKKARGRAKRTWGKLSGSRSIEADGLLDKIDGVAQEKSGEYDDVFEKAKETLYEKFAKSGELAKEQSKKKEEA